MGMIIDGGDLETKTSMPNLYKAISQAIIKIYYASQNEIKFDKYLQDAIRSLRKINLIETRSKIELKRYHSTQYPAFLWQEKIKQKLHFFASMIGFIDGFIDDYTRKIEIFYSNFDNQINEIDQINEIHEYKNKQMYLLEIRNSILLDFTKKKIDFEPTILQSTLETIPAHKSFSELYNNAIENKYQLNLQQELVSAYNIGYKSVGYYELNETLTLYKELSAELDEYEQLNQDTLEKEKNRKFLKFKKIGK